MKLLAGTVMASSLIVAPAIVFAFPPDPTPEARALFRDKKYDEAAKKLEAYLATNKFDGRAWSLYSECLHFGKNYEPAIVAAKKALDCGLQSARHELQHRLRLRAARQIR